jgi:uncharacterized protein
MLTVGTLAWLARCERRVWLDRYGDRTLQVSNSPMATRHATAGVVHEAEVMATMLAPAQPVAVPDWPALIAETQALMHAGAATIRQGGLEAHWGSGMRLCGRPDILRRTPQPSRLGAWSYEPVEIKQHGAATSHDATQLDLYRWLLTQVQGTTPEGELWLGVQDGRPAAIIRRSDPLDALEQHLLPVTRLRQDTEPPITFARHCAYCAWRSACDQAAHARQDIALLAGLDRRTAGALRRDGVTTLEALAALPATRLTRYPYVGAIRAAQFHAHAQALIRRAPYRKAEPPSPLPTPALFFDVESHPDTQEPWAFGVLDAAGNPGIAIVSARHVTAGRTHANITSIPVVFVHDVAAGWQQVAARAGRDAGAILHWGRYEQTCLDRTGGQRAQAVLRSRLADLHPMLDARYALPIPRSTAQTTGSLKAVGAYLGHRWPDEADWHLAWEQYTTWQGLVAQTPFGGAPAAELDAHLALALAYLRADLEALRHVWIWLVAREIPSSP